MRLIADAIIVCAAAALCPVAAAAPATASPATHRRTGRLVDVPGVRAAMQVVAGEWQACALDTGGRVGCWGSANRDAPLAWQRVAALPAAVAIHSGGQFFCADDRVGASRCWGNALWLPNIQVDPDNFQAPRFRQPQVVDGPGGFARAVEITPRCGRRADGAISCGDPRYIDPRDAAPVTRVPLSGPAVLLTGGYWQGCALLASGRAACWGANSHGQLGRGTTADFADAAPVAGVDRLRAIANLNEHTCAIDADAHVWCWGRNDAGQLGDGTRVERHAPVRVSGLDDARPIAIGANEAASCALLASRRVRCWGSGRDGMIGDGTFQDRTRPVEVAGLDDAVELDAGWDFFCARRASGRVACWGKILGEAD